MVSCLQLSEHLVSLVELICRLSLLGDNGADVLPLNAQFLLNKGASKKDDVTGKVRLNGRVALATSCL